VDIRDTYRLSASNTNFNCRFVSIDRQTWVDLHNPPLVSGLLSRPFLALSRGSCSGDCR
jgi:hypothetical protein